MSYSSGLVMTFAERCLPVLSSKTGDRRLYLCDFKQFVECPLLSRMREMWFCIENRSFEDASNVARNSPAVLRDTIFERGKSWL